MRDWFGTSRDGHGVSRANWRWALLRLEGRLANRLIVWLIRRYRWHNTILDTAVPNVPFLKVKSLVVVNGYGQEHVIR